MLVDRCIADLCIELIAATADSTATLIEQFLLDLGNILGADITVTTRVNFENSTISALRTHGNPKISPEQEKKILEFI